MERQRRPKVDIISQYVIMSGVFFGVASFFVPPTWILGVSVTLAILLLFFGSLVFGMNYTMDEDVARSSIKKNIEKAARDTLKNSDVPVKLSDYLHNSSYPSYRFQSSYSPSVDEEYLSTLSGRHIKWAVRYYNKCLEKLEYEQTIGSQKSAVKLENNKKVLDRVSDSEYNKKRSYHV